MPVLAPDDPKHGTPAGYQRCKPSCPSCRQANNAYQRLRRRPWEELSDPMSIVHGWPMTAELYGCDCDTCTSSLFTLQQEAEERRRRMERWEARRPHECHQVAPEGMSKADREGFICNDCLDKFQAWLQSIL